MRIQALITALSLLAVTPAFGTGGPTTGPGDVFAGGDDGEGGPGGPGDGTGRAELSIDPHVLVAGGRGGISGDCASGGRGGISGEV